MRLLLLLAALNAPLAGAAIDAYPFPNETLETRYAALIDELRCPQCLNTNLAGSDAMIAKDLRREVHRLLLEGKTDEEVRDFMHARYGDFILYKPRMNRGTAVLWFGPFVLLGVGLVIVGLVVRRGREASSPDLDADEAKRLDKLLER